MCESTMAPKVAVTDAKPESNHIKVGYHGAGRAGHPNSFWGAWAVEAGAYAKGCHSM
jgi:hypothetical protein